MTLDKTQIAKFVYIGQGGPLSLIPLKKLCDKGFRPEMVFIADKSRLPTGLALLPVQPPRLRDSLASLAAELDLPVIYWQRGCEANIAAKLADIEPDLAIMSCFPWRIAESLLNIPAMGWWNLHPSLLPAYRGPSPLFWQLRAGETQVGISLHQVTESLDSGPIIGQHTLPVSASNGRELEMALANQGADLIEHALQALTEDRLQPCLQEEMKASYQGFPVKRDMRITTTGSASAAYRFINLISPAYALWFELDGQRFDVVKGLGADDEAILNAPHRYATNQLQVQFKQGVLTVKADRGIG